MDDRDDQELLAAHVAGDENAFTVLVRRHRDRLWAVALRTMRDPDDAADALQDALLSAFRNAAGYRGDAAVTTWLHRVVVNACLDRIRRRSVRPTVLLGDTDVPTAIDEHAALDSRLDVRAALARLPEAQRAHSRTCASTALACSTGSTSAARSARTSSSGCGPGMAPLSSLAP